MADCVPLAVLDHGLERREDENQQASLGQRIEPALQPGALVLLVHEAHDIHDDVHRIVAVGAVLKARCGERAEPATAVGAAELAHRMAGDEHLRREGPGHRVVRVRSQRRRLHCPGLVGHGRAVRQLDEPTAVAGPADAKDARALAAHPGNGKESADGWRPRSSTAWPTSDLHHRHRAGALIVPSRPPAAEHCGGADRAVGPGRRRGFVPEARYADERGWFVRTFDVASRRGGGRRADVRAGQPVAVAAGGGPRIARPCRSG